MTLVVLGIDALDPELTESAKHPHLSLNASRSIETIDSIAGEPSTHELWPSIITGLHPQDHGLVLDDGVAWESPLLRWGSTFADHVLPDKIQRQVGAWLLNNTSEDAFRTTRRYYKERDIETVFDGRESKTIGIPNYVVDSDEEDREHQLRRRMGDLFERDPEAQTGHETANADEFYEQCMEMAMIRIARVRRACRSGRYELVFGYTSGLDLIGHVAYGRPTLQSRAYEELNDFVGELRDDLSDEDELLLVSDHGLQEGVHTHEAMVASTDSDLVDNIDSVLDVRGAIDTHLREQDHSPDQPDSGTEAAGTDETREEVRDQLEDLGYM